MNSTNNKTETKKALDYNYPCSGCKQIFNEKMKAGFTRKTKKCSYCNYYFHTHHPYICGSIRRKVCNTCLTLLGKSKMYSSDIYLDGF